MQQPPRLVTLHSFGLVVSVWLLFQHSFADTDITSLGGLCWTYNY